MAEHRIQKGQQKKFDEESPYLYLRTYKYGNVHSKTGGQYLCLLGCPPRQEIGMQHTNSKHIRQHYIDNHTFQDLKLMGMNMELLKLYQGDSSSQYISEYVNKLDINDTFKGIELIEKEQRKKLLDEQNNLVIDQENIKLQRKLISNEVDFKDLKNQGSVAMSFKEKIKENQELFEMMLERKVSNDSDGDGLCQSQEIKEKKKIMISLDVTPKNSQNEKQPIQEQVINEKLSDYKQTQFTQKALNFSEHTVPDVPEIEDFDKNQNRITQVDYISNLYQRDADENSGKASEVQDDVDQMILDEPVILPKVPSIPEYKMIRSKPKKKHDTIDKTSFNFAPEPRFLRQNVHKNIQNIEIDSNNSDSENNNILKMINLQNNVQEKSKVYQDEFEQPSEMY